MNPIRIEIPAGDHIPVTYCSSREELFDALRLKEKNHKARIRFKISDNPADGERDHSVTVFGLLPVPGGNGNEWVVLVAIPEIRKDFLARINTETREGWVRPVSGNRFWTWEVISNLLA